MITMHLNPFLKKYITYLGGVTYIQYHRIVTNNFERVFLEIYFSIAKKESAPKVIDRFCWDLFHSVVKLFRKKTEYLFYETLREIRAIEPRPVRPIYIF